jgi:EAL domain-containing protein (putative c-di-GMP-specific phosphodiesterase class I)
MSGQLADKGVRIGFGPSARLSDPQLGFQFHRTVSTLRPASSPSTVLLVAVTAIVLAGLTAASQPFAHTGLGLAPFWPAAGIGFALLCTQGRPAAWALAIGVTAWSGLTQPQLWPLAPVIGFAAWSSQTMAWKRLRIPFAATSQPFARQATVLGFFKVQGLLAAPWFATVVTVGHAVWLALNNEAVHPSAMGKMWASTWTSMLCGVVLFAPFTWELLISRTRSGLPRFAAKAVESLRVDWRTGIGILGLTTIACVLWAARQPVWASATLVLLLPLLAWDATRAGPLTIHLMLLLAGLVSLGATAMGLEWSGVDLTLRHDFLVWQALAVLCSAMAVQLLQVTAHERRLALRRLERQADTDPLTNLLSLTGLYRKLEELGERMDDAPDTQFGTAVDAESTTLGPALVSVQMTNTDALEQILGARKSDQVERSVSGALTSTAPNMLWARVSKSHFVGLVPHETAHNLNEQLTRLSFAALESRALVDESVGRPIWAVAAVRIESEPMPPAEVIMACLRRAEQLAQDTRQIQVLPVNRESGLALKEEAEQAERIRQHIQNKQLVLFAQPIIANANPASMPHKYEILVRLKDDSGQIVPPGLWLPIAMRAGMMQSLDLTVMEQTFEWFAAHPRALEALNHCAINLSGPTVASPAVAERIALGLQQHQLPAHKFTFEITESQAIANPGQATDTIRAIRACGCRVAIDDFGTGVATFDYLKRFDVDYIKIDGAFVKDLLDDPVDRVIVESIVKVAHQLGVRTVAEFVSSAELHQAVTELGVDESQGFAFGEPRALALWFAETDPSNL